MRRALPFLLPVLIALAGCGDKDARAPFSDSRIPPGLEHRFYPPQGWAWGLIQVGKAPPVRYGVAGPARQPVGQIIILPSYGETAEAWFWTVRDLNARGYVVWVLEGSGQGGSGRRNIPRDVVDAASLDPDVGALAVLAAHVSRQRPRYLLAAGTSTSIAARAAGLGLPLDGLILFQPALDGFAAPGAAQTTNGREDPQTTWMHRLGLGGMRRPGGQAWQAGDRTDEFMGAGEATSRHWLTRKWQQANPDLRMGDPSIDWEFAYAAQRKAATSAWKVAKTPTLVIGTDICGGRANCRHQAEITTAQATDPHSAFIGQIIAFIDPAAAALAPPPPPATLDPDA